MTIPEEFQNRFYISVDQWDGYRTERRMILEAFAQTDSVVVLTGDIHAFYANELHVDFDAPTAEPVAAEFVVAGISSASAVEIIENVLTGSPTLANLGFDALVSDYDTGLEMANPHMRHLDSRANGVAIVDVDADEINVRFLHLDDVKSPKFDGKVVESQFQVAAGSSRIAGDIVALE